MEWQLADAKNKFSEVMTRAITEGPQRVRRRQDVIFIISETDYNKIKGKNPVSFKEFLLNSDVSLEGLDLSRDRSTMRDIEL